MVFKKQNRVQLETLVRSNSLFLEAHNQSRLQNSQKKIYIKRQADFTFSRQL